MNSYMLLDAIGEIDDSFILSAQKRLENTFPQEITTSAIRPRRSSRRALIAVAAAIIFALASFTTAMAVSEDFREAVFSFFNIGTPEVVPEYTPGAQDDRPGLEYAETDIDELVGVKYIWMNDWAYASNGIFLYTEDEFVYKKGNRFELYAEENSKLVSVETQSMNMDYNWNGHNYHIEFDWGVHGNGFAFAYVADDGSNGWTASRIPDCPDKFLISFEYTLPEWEYPSQSQYPMIFDLENEMIIDVLAGCGAEALSETANAVFSADLTKALLAQYDGSLYYCDVPSKALYSVNVLSGEQTDACTFADDALICWALGEDGNYECWSISLSTFERREIFNGIPEYSAETGCGIVFISGFDIMHHGGYMYGGSTFALEVAADRNVYVVDLTTGEKTIIEGFSWAEGGYTECVINPDGTRLFISRRSDGSRGYDSIGVLSYSSKSYIELPRESFSINEHAIYWFDADRVIISTDSGEDARGTYIYSFKSFE